LRERETVAGIRCVQTSYSVISLFANSMGVMISHWHAFCVCICFYPCHSRWPWLSRCPVEI